MTRLFADCPIVMAIRDDKWTGVLVDAYDNDPVYYKHHVSDTCDGFIPRGNHYIIVAITKQGRVIISTGCHGDALPAHAYVITH